MFQVILFFLIVKHVIHHWIAFSKNFLKIYISYTIHFTFERVFMHYFENLNLQNRFERQYLKRRMKTWKENYIKIYESHIIYFIY